MPHTTGLYQSKTRDLISMTDFTLLQQLQESVNDKGRLKAVFVCGIPGAGKSYTITTVQDGTIQPRIINSDKMYEFLGRTGKIDVSNPDAWPDVKDTVHRTTQAQLAHYVNGLLPLFVDSTSADPGNLLRRKGILESLGYDVGVVWVETKLEDALARAAQRERAVPEEFIRKVHERANEAKSFLLARFDWKIELMNSDGELTNAVVKKAYNATRAFFNEDVHNPIGQQILRKLEETGDKYLVPTVFDGDEIRHLTSAWFKK